MDLKYFNKSFLILSVSIQSYLLNLDLHHTANPEFVAVNVPRLKLFSIARISSIPSIFYQPFLL